MIGQTRLKNIFNTITLETLPKNILLSAPKGFGKHTLIYELAKRLDLNTNDITDNVSLETLNSLYDVTIPTLIIVDLSILSIAKQTILLKTLEESNQNIYFCLLSSDNMFVLDSIKNRCVYYQFDIYKKEELLIFLKETGIEDIGILDYIKIPGDILKLNPYNINDYDTLTSKIINSMSIANISNTLTIIDKFNFDNDFDKLDPSIFINMLIGKLKSLYYEKQDFIYENAIMLSISYRTKVFDKDSFSRYIIELWKIFN